MFGGLGNIFSPPSLPGLGGGGGGSSSDSTFSAGSSGSGSAGSNSGFGSKQNISENTNYTENQSTTLATDRRIVADGSSTVINAEAGTTLNLSSDAAAFDVIKEMARLNAGMTASIADAIGSASPRGGVSDVWNAGTEQTASGGADQSKKWAIGAGVALVVGWLFLKGKK